MSTRHVAHSGIEISLADTFFVYNAPLAGVSGGVGQKLLEAADVAATHGQRIQVIAGNDTATELRGAVVLPTRPADPELEPRYHRWTGSTGAWPRVLLDAHLTKNLGIDTARALYAAGGASPFPVGSVPHVLDFVERHQGDRAEEIRAYHAARYRDQVLAVPSGSTVRFQDAWQIDLMLMTTQELRARDVRYVLDVHTPIDPRLTMSSWGRAYLTAMSQVDQVNVHNRTFAREIDRQLRELGLPVPELCVIRHGVNVARIERSLREITPDNFREKVPGFAGLDPEQQDLITHLMTTRFAGTARFICADRAGVEKGSLIVARAIRRVLEEERRAGLTNEKLAEKYSFNFVARHGPAIAAADKNPFDINGLYAKMFRAEVDALIREFGSPTGSPVRICEALSGPAADALPALYIDCHALAGGIQEGLHMVPLELLLANHLFHRGQPMGGRAVTMISGGGTGIMIEAHDEGFAGLVNSVPPGDVEAMARGILEVANQSERDRHAMGIRSFDFVTEHVVTRTGSLLSKGQPPGAARHGIAGPDSTRITFRSADTTRTDGNLIGALGITDPKAEHFVMLCPHDDDGIMGASMLVHDARRLGIDVTVVVVTDGRMGYGTLDQRDRVVETRQDETRAAYARLGVEPENVHFLGYPDASLDRHTGRVPATDDAPDVRAGHTGLFNSLVAELRAARATRVFLPTSADRHPDHVTLFAQADMARFMAGGGVWTEELGPTLGVAPRLYEYPVYGRAVPERAGRTEEIELVGSTAAFDLKLTALDCFASQGGIGGLKAKLRASPPVERFFQVP